MCFSRLPDCLRAVALFPLKTVAGVMGLMRLLISLLVGVIAYVIWYGVTVGHFCPAMWFGTAPPVIILLSSVAAYRILGGVGGRR
jgi:hypothetical protein